MTKEKKQTILVIDDSAIIRGIIRKELESGGYEVIEAQDGITGLTKAVAHLPDLITLDVEMPKLDGFETYKKLNDNYYSSRFTHKYEKRMPIVFITSQDTLEGRQKGFELGAYEFLTKPFVNGQVLAIVDKILKPSQRMKGMSALIVDDSFVARKIVSDIFISEGIQTIECEDGIQALEAIANLKNEPDVIITDFEMPNMDGEKLCKEIRKEVNFSDVPIIFLTGVSEQSYLIDLFKAGATDYLVKPFVKEALIARVFSHIERSHLTKNLKKTIKSLKKANEEIRILSITDPLTNCYNRGYLVSHLEKEIKRSKRYNHTLSLILCDIDHFKKVNDTYGHQAGDLVLKEFVLLIKELIRTNIDWVARYGGEEFAIVLPETPLDGANAIAERIRVKTSEKEFSFDNKNFYITSSFGVTNFDSTVSEEKSNFNALLSKVDSLLYKSKNSGRNKVTYEEL